MKHRVGRAAGARHSGDGIFESLAAENLAGQNSLLQGIHDHCAAAESDFVFGLVHRGHTVEAHRRQSNQFHHSGHGVGGVLAPAGARAWTRNIFQFQQVGIGHFSSCIRADRFENILDSDVFAFEIPRRDRSPIEHHAGNIQTGHGHGRRGNRLVASHDAHHSIEKLPAADQLYGIGDDLAAYQRGAHALGAHGFAVRDGNGVELHGGSTGGANTFFHLGRKAAQVKVTWHGFDPGIGHADDGLFEIFIGEPDALEHGAGGRTVATVGDSMTAMFGIHMSFRIITWRRRWRGSACFSRQR